MAWFLEHPLDLGAGNLADPGFASDEYSQVLVTGRAAPICSATTPATRGATPATPATLGFSKKRRRKETVWKDTSEATKEPRDSWDLRAISDSADPENRRKLGFFVGWKNPLDTNLRYHG